MRLFALALCLLVPATALADELQALPRVTMEVEDQSLAEVLKTLGLKYGLNYVASRHTVDAAGAVYFRLKDVPLDRAVQMIAAACDLEAEVQGKFAVLRKPRGSKPSYAFPSDAKTPKAKPSSRFFPGAGGLGKAKTRKVKAITGRPSKGKSSSTLAKPSAPAKRAPAVALGSSSSVRGHIVGKPSGSSLKVSSEDGSTATYYIPESAPGDTTFKLTRLSKSVGRLAVTDRVMITYRQSGKGKRWIDAIIGGPDPMMRRKLAKRWKAEALRRVAAGESLRAPAKKSPAADKEPAPAKAKKPEPKKTK